MLINGPPELPGLTLGADDAGRHRVLEPEGRADRDHPLADTQLVGVADAHGRKAARVDLEQRDIGPLVRAEQLRLELALVMQGDRDLVGALHHVRVGQQIAVGGDDEPRAQSARNVAARSRRLLARPLGPLLRRIGEKATEELVHRIVLVEIRNRQRPLLAAPDAGRRADAGHGGPDAVGEVREVRQCLGRLRRDAG
jgi:hypothetical protein